MRQSSLAPSFSPSLLLRLRTRAAALNVLIRQRCNRVWLRLINLFGIPTPSLYGHPTDYVWDREIDFPEFWADYLDEPEVLSSISAHLDRCYANPSAKHHGH